MNRARRNRARRATILVLIVGLLTMLFMVVSAYITLARFDRLTARLTSQGDTIGQITQSLGDVLASIVSRPAVDDPTVSLMGVNYALIPGNPGARWLASLDPVRDPNAIADGPGYKPDDFLYPSVTSLAGGSVRQRPIGDLMFGDPNRVGEIDPYQPLWDPNRYAIRNAREPFMDADGDGIADADFRGSALGTELANAIAGRAVTVDPNQPFEPNVWAFFDAQARYEVAVRIISHGGMVLLDNPSDAPAWNARFLTHMFNALRHPNDNDDALNPDDLDHLSLLRSVGSERAANEPVLRHRGGLLTSLRTAQNSNPSALSPSLRALGMLFPNTVYPTWDWSAKPNTYERFNLAAPLGREWKVWYQAASLDSDEYNRTVSGSAADPRYKYVPRRLLTTVNNSDELARKRQGYPSVDNGLTLGIRPGQLKFYLGRIQNAFSNGYFDPVNGAAIIRELAGYYAEMLSGYSGWRPGGLWGLGLPAIPSQPVSLREQALMLAVNTVAFAAPRDANGYIASVWYDDTETISGQVPVYQTKRYYGYLPQPHITQVVVSYGSDEMDPNDPNVPALGLALAVELYNPHDSLWSQTPDTHALDLTQFAITVDVVAGQPLGYTGLIPLAGSHLRNPTGPCATGRLPGRTFMAIGIPYEGADGHHDPFGNTYVDASVPGRALSYHEGENIEVRLWRHHREQDIWYLVDRMYLDSSSLAGAGVDPNAPWYANIERDTGYEPYFGQYSDASYSELRPRWRMIAAFPPNSQNKTVVGGSAAPTSVLAQLRRPVEEGTLYFPFGPCTPMYTMNAGASPYPLHGALRPASFPTVGFLLFVPRFSHVCRLEIQSYRCMGEILYEQWHLRSGTDLVVYVPVDLGHMPVFDNTQKTAGIGSAEEAVGRVPWGQLVFDYFTTLSPNGPDGVAGTADDVDPYRVPGRININVAPWQVLANLPAFGPAVLPQTGSPAFWSPGSGVLAGMGLSGTPRSVLYRFDPNGAVNGQWYRLGARLAQAAAAYRDRIAYGAETLPDPWRQAWKRGGDPNSPDSGAMYRPIGIYGFIRGCESEAPESHKFGFTTLGELANVLGFDGSTDGELNEPLTTAASRGDFMRAVSALALLDTHFLTTRSNTFTVYASVIDREKPQSSTRLQFTVDRSRLLPRIQWFDLNQNGIRDAEPTDRYELMYGEGSPEIIGLRKTAYFNTRYDE